MVNSWNVEPAPFLSPARDAGFRPNMSHWGCLAPVFLVILLFLLILIPGVEFSWFLLAPATLPVIVAAYADFRLQVRSAHESWVTRAANDQQRLQEDARRATSQANLHLKHGTELIDSLNAHLDAASTALTLSEHEFSERAFAPFWDMVETSAAAIDAFRHDVDRFNCEAACYCKALNGRQHNFPAWHDAVPPVPDPRDTLARFRVQVRKGQTDRDFAIILEHRLTREVLIAGFRNFGEVLGKLESSLMESIERLNRTVSSLKYGP
jgi:hypothetical protein